MMHEHAPDRALARAVALLDAAPLIDGHNDLPHTIRQAAGGDVAQYDLRARKERRDTDIPRLIEGRVRAQVLAAYVPPKEAQPASYALQQVALIRRLVLAYPDDLMLATRPADIARASRTRRIAVIASIENGAAIEGRIDALEGFHALGVRLITLCHNL